LSFTVYYSSTLLAQEFLKLCRFRDQIISFERFRCYQNASCRAKFVLFLCHYHISRVFIGFLSFFGDEHIHAMHSMM